MATKKKKESKLVKELKANIEHLKQEIEKTKDTIKDNIDMPRCHQCGDDFDEGDTIIDVSGEKIHVDCSSDYLTDQYSTEEVDFEWLLENRDD